MTWQPTLGTGKEHAYTNIHTFDYIECTCMQHKQPNWCTCAMHTNPTTKKMKFSINRPEWHLVCLHARAVFIFKTHLCRKSAATARLFCNVAVAADFLHKNVRAELTWCILMQQTAVTALLFY